MACFGNVAYSDLRSDLRFCTLCHRTEVVEMSIALMITSYYVHTVWYISRQTDVNTPFAILQGLHPQRLNSHKVDSAGPIVPHGMGRLHTNNGPFHLSVSRDLLLPSWWSLSRMTVRYYAMPCRQKSNICTVSATQARKLGELRQERKPTHTSSRTWYIWT
jgi:hypothetical protein